MRAVFELSASEKNGLFSLKSFCRAPRWQHRKNFMSVRNSVRCPFGRRRARLAGLDGFRVIAFSKLTFRKFSMKTTTRITHERCDVARCGKRHSIGRVKTYKMRYERRRSDDFHFLSRKTVIFLQNIGFSRFLFGTRLRPYA